MATIVTGTAPDLTIGRTTYTVEAIETEVDGKKHTGYRLTGPRGARYFTMRNVHRHDHLFLVNERNFAGHVPCEWVLETAEGLRVMA